MVKNLILLIFPFAIIFQKTIAIEIFNLNNSIDLTTFSEFRFTNNFRCEFIFTLENPHKGIRREQWIFSIHSPLNSISVRAKRFMNTIDLIFNGKLITFYNNILFDGNWHKVVFQYISGSAGISIDCSYVSPLKPLSVPKEAIEYPEKPITNFNNTFYHIDDDVDLKKFVIYDVLFPGLKYYKVQNCEDVNETITVKPEIAITLNPIKPVYDLKVDCVLSETLMSGRQVCEGELIFEDNFDTFNNSKWEHEIRIPLDSDDAEYVSYQDYPHNCFINFGKLNLKPTLLAVLSGFDIDSIRRGSINLGPKCTFIINEETECTREAHRFRILPPISSAKIRTKNSFSFQYGRIDVRAKLPIGDWIFPQIYLEPLISNYGTGSYKSGQMRVAYIRSNEHLTDNNLLKIGGYRLYGGVVLQVGEFLRDHWMESSLQSSHLSNDYHVYSMIWTNESITLLLDNVNYGFIEGGFKNIKSISHAKFWKRGEFMAPFDKEFYISLGVAVGGISDFPDNSRNGVEGNVKPWDNLDPKGELSFWKDRHMWKRTWKRDNVAMKVDYVKVWAL